MKLSIGLRWSLVGSRRVAAGQVQWRRRTGGGGSMPGARGAERAERIMSQREKYEAVEREVRALYSWCRAVGTEGALSERELELVSAPLGAAVGRAALQRRARAAVRLTLLAALAALACAALRSEWAGWRAAALARAALLRALPLWDWRPLHRRACLLERPGEPVASASAASLHYSDCVTCEAVHYISRLADTSYEEIYNKHLVRGAPVIVSDAYRHRASSSADLNLTNLIDQDDRLSDSVPCRVFTNIRIGKQPMDLQEIISRITNTNVPNWFVHFQNCDIRAVKSFRVLAPRPYFIPPHVKPSHFNWILMSNRYNAQRYKYLELDVGLILMSQLKGSTNVFLKPRAPCEEECPSLSFELTEGETLVLANSLWEFEYLPDKTGENVAILTETDWDEV